MIEQRSIECEQYIDDIEPTTLTLVPSGRTNPMGKKLFLLVSEDPECYDIQLVTHDEFVKLIHNNIQKAEQEK